LEGKKNRRAHTFHAIEVVVVVIAIFDSQLHASMKLFPLPESIVCLKLLVRVEEWDITHVGCVPRMAPVKC
jgi:hypothetical protein